MKYYAFLSLFILIIVIKLSNQAPLNLKQYSTKKYKMATRSWTDLIGISVACPNNGVLKNFVLRADFSAKTLWYDYSCYSSLSSAADIGEPVVKGLTLHSTYSKGFYIKNTDIRNINDYPVECWVDYGLVSFQLYNDRNYILRREAVCHGLKSKYSTSMNVNTGYKVSYYSYLDGLVGTVVGSTAKENNQNVAYPLRGFRYKIINNGGSVKVGYVYAYSILRDMKAVYDNAKASFQRLRNGNTQKD